VKPVNDSDIVLPTDGFRSPNDAQRLLRNLDSDGVSGGQRPGPTVKQQTGAAPGISQSGGKPSAPTQPRRESQAAISSNPSTAPGKPAAPGFSFK